MQSWHGHLSFLSSTLGGSSARLRDDHVTAHDWSIENWGFKCSLILHESGNAGLAELRSAAYLSTLSASKTSKDFQPFHLEPVKVPQLLDTCKIKI